MEFVARAPRNGLGEPSVVQPQQRAPKRHEACRAARWRHRSGRGRPAMGRSAIWDARAALLTISGDSRGEIMGLVLASLGNAAANLVQAAASDASQGAGGWFANATAPDWLQVAIALAALVTAAIGVNVLIAFKNKFPDPQKSDAKALTKMLCEQVWLHTDDIANILGQRLRDPPADIASMRIRVRHLREDLAAPANFVEQMRGHPARDWPSATVFQAFNNWGGQIVAMASQLADLHQAITYPLVREPVDKNRDAMLVYQYHTEQAFLDRGIEKLRGYAFDFCAAAAKHLEKKKAQGGHEEDEEEHAKCPCCRRAAERHSPARADPLRAIVLPPAPAPAPPPPPPPPPPPAATCRCAAPRICQCTPACVCVCTCTAATKPA